MPISVSRSKTCQEDGFRLELWQISTGSTVCIAAMIELRPLDFMLQCYSLVLSHRVHASV